MLAPSAGRFSCCRPGPRRAALLGQLFEMQVPGCGPGLLRLEVQAVELRMRVSKASQVIPLRAKAWHH